MFSPVHSVTCHQLTVQPLQCSPRSTLFCYGASFWPPLALPSTLSHLSIMLNRLFLSDAHSRRILFCFMSSFRRSIHLSWGLPSSGAGSVDVSVQHRLCNVVIVSPLHITEQWQSFLHEESVYCLYVCLVPDDNISDVIFTCIHLSIFIYDVLLWFCSHFRIAQHSSTCVIAA